jgi:hypothetical protein
MDPVFTGGVTNTFFFPYTNTITVVLPSRTRLFPITSHEHGLMDKTKPHGLFLKDNFFSKLFTIGQQSFPRVVTLIPKVIAFSRAVMARKR